MEKTGFFNFYWPGSPLDLDRMFQSTICHLSLPTKIKITQMEDNSCPLVYANDDDHDVYIE